MSTLPENDPQVLNAASTTAIVTDLDPQVVPGNSAFGNRYTRAYKLKILQEADACTKPGEIGQLLRRTGITHTTLTSFRRQRAAGTLDAPTLKSKSQSASAPTPENTKRILELERENRKLKRQLLQAEAIIDVQKKVARLLEISGPARRLKERVSKLVQERTPVLPIAPLLQALGLSRATYYRKQATSKAATETLPENKETLPENKETPPADKCVETVADAPVEDAKQPEQPVVDPLAPSRCRVPGRALSPEERKEVYKRLYEERFIDRTPTEIWATLLDEDTYLCSVSTLYRLLKADRANPKRTQKSSNYAKPELLATGPNQLWSWDITKLKGPVAWTYFHLYVIIDVYSRCVVGWMLAYRESKELAKQFIDETLAKHNIAPGTLTIHADRGSAMTSKSVALLLSDLGVVKTHSRPHVSNDNPYSESQFKTLKTRPEFPDRFRTIEEARALVEQLMNWYNNEHHHGGIALLTPLMVHSGQADVVIAKRQSHLDQAYQAHPERFVNQPPRHAQLPETVWINRPLPAAEPSRDDTGDENAPTA